MKGVPGAIPLTISLKLKKRKFLKWVVFLFSAHLSPGRIKLSLELSMCAGPCQGIFHFAEATASVLVKELSLAYYDMFAVVRGSFKTVGSVCVCVCVCVCVLLMV